MGKATKNGSVAEAAVCSLPLPRKVKQPPRRISGIGNGCQASCLRKQTSGVWGVTPLPPKSLKPVVAINLRGEKNMASGRSDKLFFQFPETRELGFSR